MNVKKEVEFRLLQDHETLKGYDWISGDGIFIPYIGSFAGKTVAEARERFDAVYKFYRIVNFNLDEKQIATKEN